MEEFVSWPFAVTKPDAELNAFDHDLVDFRQAASIESFRPRVNHSFTEIEVDESSGRTALLVFRGSRNGWEPFLTESEQSVRLGPSYALPLGESACVCIRPPFRAAGYFAIEWLRGRSLKSLLDEFQFVGGSPSGIELRKALDGQELAGSTRGTQ